MKSVWVVIPPCCEKKIKKTSLCWIPHINIILDTYLLFRLNNQLPDASHLTLFNIITLLITSPQNLALILFFWWWKMFTACLFNAQSICQHPRKFNEMCMCVNILFIANNSNYWSSSQKIYFFSPYEHTHTHTICTVNWS